MTDHTPTPDPDEVLRRALQAEADGVDATDALLDRTLAAAGRPALRPGRRLLAAAAVAAIAIGAGVLVVSQDGDPQLDTIDDPITTSTTEPGPPPDGLPDLLSVLFTCTDTIQTEVFVDADATEAQRAAITSAMSRDDEPLAIASEEVRQRLLDHYADDSAALEVIEAHNAPSVLIVTSDDPDEELRLRGEVSDLEGVEFVTSIDCRDHTNRGQPTTVVLVREDGWLVVVDLESGEERELYTYGDPSDTSQEGGPYFIDFVDLAPDGEWVYFSTCCEPAAGTTYRIAVSGGEPEQISFGAYPRVSPDGQQVATSSCQRISVTTLDGETLGSLDVDDCVGHLAWSPDGRQLAATTSVGPDAQPQAVLFDWDGTNLTLADPGKPDNPGSFVSWTPDGMLTISSGGPVDDDRSLSQDTSYQWLLWVDEAGVVRGQAGHESGDRAPIAGLPEAIAADW